MGFRHGIWKHEQPDFRNEGEKLKYYIREEKRWHSGFDGLSGDYYYYLTQFTIKNRVTGERLSPDMRPVDKDVIFPWLAEVDKKKADGMWITQRGAGKSTIMNGFLPLKTAIWNPGCKVIMTSEAVDTTKMNFSDKLKISYDGMDEFYRPGVIGTWPDEKSDKQFVKFGKREKGQNDSGLLSTIQSVETAFSAKSPSKLEGQGARAVIVDEIFKHPYVEEVRSRGAALVREFMRKEGSLYYVGSLSDATAKGLKNALDMWQNAATYGIVPLFVDASWFNPFIPVYNEDGSLVNNKYTDVRDSKGYVDRVKAREALLNNRRILEKLPNKKAFMEHCLQYPNDINELLDIATDSWWEDETVMMYKDQKHEVDVAVKNRNFNKCDQPAYIHPKQDGDMEIKFIEKREGAKYYIFELPVIGRTYGVGIDTIPFTTINEKGSDHIAAVKCFDTNQYVAYYAERTYDADDAARRTIYLQKLYNNAVALVEKNSIGALKTSYKHSGNMDMLAWCPRRFRAKNARPEKGLNKDKNTTELRLLVRDYVKSNMQDIWIDRFFAEFFNFPFENTDFMDAMAMAEALHEEYRTIMHKRTIEEKFPASSVSFTTNAKGERVMVTGNGGAAKPGGDFSHLFTMQKK